MFRRRALLLIRVVIGREGWRANIVEVCTVFVCESVFSFSLFFLKQTQYHIFPMVREDAAMFNAYVIYQAPSHNYFRCVYVLR